MADDKLQIPDADRIHNISPLPDNFDPNDDTLLNADWVMRIFDKIVNGEYAIKPFTVVATVVDLPSENVVAGQTAYVEAEPSHFYLYDGSQWVQIPNLSETGGTVNDSTVALTLNGITQGSFTTNQATDSAINFDIPTASDATVTLTLDGVTQGSFTLDQLNDQTINFDIPTASDATITLTAAGMTQGSFTLDQKNDQTIDLNIDTANNSTITIVQDGITQGSFTLNQANDQTINLAGGSGGGTVEMVSYDGITGTTLVAEQDLTNLMMLFKNGNLLEDGASNDYTVNGLTITFTDSLVSEDKVTLMIGVPGDSSIGNGQVSILVNGQTQGFFTTNQVGDTDIDLPINDGNMTLLMDGITQGSFSANQDTDSVIDIPAVAKPTTISISDTVISLNVVPNTDYFLTSAVTALTLSSMEQSSLESNIYFTTGNTIAFVDNILLSNWVGVAGSPILNINTQYIISIRNGKGVIGTVNE